MLDGDGFNCRTLDNHLVLCTKKELVDPSNGHKVLKIGVSLCSGCSIRCKCCFTQQYNFRILSPREIVDQVELVFDQRDIDINSYDERKISFKQMGDPLINSDNTLSAIKKLEELYPDFSFVVSTSAPLMNQDFFEKLSLYSDIVRLQFSCHTTSNEERNNLSSSIPMMSFSQIAEIVNKWEGERVTLNFMLIKGFTVSVRWIASLFDINKVFIKINYIDRNRFTDYYKLVDSNNDLEIMNELRSYGFQWSSRIFPKDRILPL